MRISYLGPAGTFSEEALTVAVGERDFEGAPSPTIHAAIETLAAGEADRAFVPIENSIEGTVRPTLDALAFGSQGLAIVGEYDHAVHQALIARRALQLGEIEVVLSHPQPLAQCARFLREHLPAAEVRPVSSTSEGVRAVAEAEAPWAALGSAAAAAAYGCVALRDDVADEEDNVTRFAWLARAGEAVPAEDPGSRWRTTLVFWELGDDRPGALTAALAELSNRGINMSRIESRPRRAGLGRYLFFVDLDGRADDAVVAAGIEALRAQAETVRVLGSYQVGGPAPIG